MRDVRNMSTAELVSDVATDVSRLVRKEVELATAEVVSGLKSWATGLGIVALALIASLPGLLFLVIALALWLPVGPAAGFAIVGAAMLLFTAGGLAFGVWKLKKRNPAPKAAIESVKEDVKWARGHLTR